MISLVWAIRNDCAKKKNLGHVERLASNLRGERILLPASAPDHGGLILVALFTIAPEEDVIITLALYHDPRTKRFVDYLELYDVEGGLLLISWFDRFGVQRAAMDRGLLDEEEPEVEGVLVPIPLGTPS